nr:RHS repeat-associated core domain-containing protein [Ureibacillus terrenus]
MPCTCRTYIYDAFDQLVEVRDASGQWMAKFTYDDSGKRTSMTTANGTIYFHYHQDKVIYETDENGNIITEYTWDDEGNPVSMTKNGQTYYYHLNGHGDVVALTDSNGNVVAEYEYDAWGNILRQTGALASENPYRYAGYRYDEVTGLYYLMSRYYDADMGRFLMRDTFHGFEDDPLSLNQYAYTKNNPVMYVDPDGNFAISIERVKYALKYGLRGWLASYFGWSTADQIVAGSVAILDKVSKAVQEIIKGYKAGKAINTVFKKALNEVLIGRGYKNEILKIVRSQARKIGTKVALKGITKISFWWTDIALFSGYTVIGYYKYHK